MLVFRHAPNESEHRYHDFPILCVGREWSLHLSNALPDDRYAVLHRDRNDDRRCVTEPDLLDAAHQFADVLDDHQNCVDGHHRGADDLDAHHDHRSDHHLLDDRDLLDDHRHDADDLGGLSRRFVDDLDALDGRQNDHAWPDDHHRDADATDDQSQNCVHDLDDRHRYADGLDGHRDQQICHLKSDDLRLDDLTTDDHDLLVDHHRCVDEPDGLNQNCVDDLDGRHRDAGDLDDHLRYVGDLGDRHRDVDGRVVNRHDEGLWLQRHLGELDGLNHYLVLGDADRFCLV
ncbi:MAG: hypothetical protein NWS27_07950 [Ilumatobacteraceae bacterium]|nr:hypothetical protein [Ilumatobacteraceae bacterium]